MTYEGVASPAFRQVRHDILSEDAAAPIEATRRIAAHISSVSLAYGPAVQESSTLRRHNVRGTRFVFQVRPRLLRDDNIAPVASRAPRAPMVLRSRLCHRKTLGCAPNTHCEWPAQIDSARSPSAAGLRLGGEASYVGTRLGI